jgi:translation initiation factor 3 subunit D
MLLDFVTVNENAADPPADTDKPDAINSPASLSLEATYINQNFACQVVDQTKRKAFKDPNPFYSTEETEPLASCAYRYRKFDLSLQAEQEATDKVKMVVRTEVDAYQNKKDQYITIKALNEFDPRAQGSGKAPDWRSKLDASRGAVVATEMKNNSAKLARWAVQSVLAGAETMKLGFISRQNPKDPQRHTIVGVQSHKPRDFAGQMAVSLANGWGIVRMIVDLCMKQPEGRYVLVKDPNNVSLAVRLDAWCAIANRFYTPEIFAAPCPTVCCACRRSRGSRGAGRGRGGRRGQPGLVVVIYRCNLMIECSRIRYMVLNENGGSCADWG